jgi:hypothetical protein
VYYKPEEDCETGDKLRKKERSEENGI